jgi:hypothetical protein
MIHRYYRADGKKIDNGDAVMDANAVSMQKSQEEL